MDVRHTLFQRLDRPEFLEFFKQGQVAVGVSGGPDSMAMAQAVCLFAAQEFPDCIVHVVTVDHGLRASSAQEAALVRDQVAGWANAVHDILVWEGEKPEQRLQEAARSKRYDLLGEYCLKHDIGGLFLGHHQDDQAETFLFRLSKGSGLDGLSCMRCRQQRGTLTLLRPFLDLSKEDLLDFCSECDVRYALDPSNDKDVFARVRLRQARTTLEAEGLSNKRLAKTALRLCRAREALDAIALDIFETALLSVGSIRIEFEIDVLLSCHEEVLLRVLKRARLEILGSEAAGYGPREEKFEDLVYALKYAQNFKPRTLGGLIFHRDRARGVVALERE